MKPPRAVLMDMDGTLIDAFAPIIYALNKTLESYGKAAMSDEAVIRHTGKGECSMISLFGEHREEAAQRFLAFHDERLFEITPLPGAEALLQGLRQQGIKTAIVTSKSQQRADQQLQHLGWTGWLDVVIGLEPGRRQKPDPHTVQLACDRLQLSAADCWMIGDGTADMKAAQRAGVPVRIGISNSFSEAELRDAGATHCFATLNKAWLWLTTRIH